MNSMSLLILTTELQMSPLLIMTVSATALYPELSLFSFTTADCPRLEDIPNGSLEVSTTLNITAAVYTCDEGFELVGSQLEHVSMIQSGVESLLFVLVVKI